MKVFKAWLTVAALALGAVGGEALANEPPSGDLTARVVNGRLWNRSNTAVRCWAGDRGFFDVPPNTSSRTSHPDYDVDHCYAEGSWWKIRWDGEAVVTPGGSIYGTLCKVSNYGQPCP